LLTARGEDYSQLAGFDAGADDYMVKPISPKVLVARIRSLLKMKNGSIYHMPVNGSTENDITINREYYSVMKNNREIQLPRKEFEILIFLMMNKNRIASKSAIAENIWGDNIDQVADFDFIYSQIKDLRKKLRENNANIDISTIYGMGYKLIVK
jgi:DNA-binding response OmpR family regulator